MKIEIEFEDLEDEFRCPIANKAVRLWGKAMFDYPDKAEPVRVFSVLRDCSGYPGCKEEGVSQVGIHPCPYQADVIEQLMRFVTMLRRQRSD